MALAQLQTFCTNAFSNMDLAVGFLRSNKNQDALSHLNVVQENALRAIDGLDSLNGVLSKIEKANIAESENLQRKITETFNKENSEKNKKRGMEVKKVELEKQLKSEKSELNNAVNEKRSAESDLRKAKKRRRRNRWFGFILMPLTAAALELIKFHDRRIKKAESRINLAQTKINNLEKAVKSVNSDLVTTSKEITRLQATIDALQKDRAFSRNKLNEKKQFVAFVIQSENIFDQIEVLIEAAKKKTDVTENLVRKAEEIAASTAGATFQALIGQFKKKWNDVKAFLLENRAHFNDKTLRDEIDKLI